MIARSSLTRRMMAASTLVETVSINYEDFAEGFLTCSTCLYTYDNGEHTPKLLPCSHTVCKTCLEKMTSLPGVRESDSFRCPICRQSIALPRGGVVSLPPAFLVNQLLDLVAKQRRDVVPKCSTHPQQELLFCESCHIAFCRVCHGGCHGGDTNVASSTLANQSFLGRNSPGVSEHTVSFPFLPFIIDH